MKQRSHAADSQTFVVYHRVSTKQQGSSGLGLEAQERMTGDYVAQLKSGRILSSFTEVESGKRSDRPELRKALALARKRKATLLVAKLDRLARNVAFVSALMEAGVEFKAADFPDASRVMIHILAAIAEYEAKLISDRTKAGLESRRLRMIKLDPNFKLGNAKSLRRGSSPAPAINRARAAAAAERLRPVINDFRSKGITSARAIAKALNDAGHVSDRGCEFYAATVGRVLKRLKGAS
jgi:DNA invertase Pin-like site-specific DNA recombinase